MKKQVLLLIVLGYICFAIAIAMRSPSPLPGCTDSCPIGLTNCGNTCWMNAALQCLFNMDEFNQEVIKVSYPACSLAARYVSLYKAYMNTNSVLTSEVLQPFVQALNKKMGIDSSGFQQDSQEGMTNVLDAVLSSKDSFVARQKIVIQEKQEIADLSGDVKASASQEPSEYLLVRVSPGEEKYGLENLLAHYFAHDSVEYGADHKLHTRKLSLEQLSDYLIIAVGIFATDFTSETLQKQKIYWEGTVPETLDMASFVDASKKGAFPLRYNLIGAVVHMGSLNGGHYAAYINKDNRWYYCSDDTIRLISTRTFSGEPYILFYKRTDVKDVPVSVPAPTAQEWKNLDENCEYNQLVELAESLQELSQTH